MKPPTAHQDTSDETEAPRGCSVPTRRKEVHAGCMVFQPSLEQPVGQKETTGTVYRDNPKLASSRIPRHLYSVASNSFVQLLRTHTHTYTHKQHVSPCSNSYGTPATLPTQTPEARHANAVLQHPKNCNYMPLFRLHLSKDSSGTVPRTAASSRFPRCAAAAHCLGPRKSRQLCGSSSLQALFCGW